MSSGRDRTEAGSYVSTRILSKWRCIAACFPGRFHTLREHLDDRKISGVERGAEYLLSQSLQDRTLDRTLGQSHV